LADFVAEVGPMDRFQRPLTFQKLCALPLASTASGKALAPTFDATCLPSAPPGQFDLIA